MVTGDAPAASWLLLLVQLPAKPAYVRIKTARTLQRLGAAAIKNAVYALPHTDANVTAYNQLMSDVLRAGGEAVVCEARFVGGLSNADVRALFDRARDSDYEQLARDARKVLHRKQIAAADVERIRRRCDEIARIDFFSAHGRQAVDDLIVELDRKLRRHPDVSRTEAPPKLTRAELKNRVWVTRRHVHVDRIASAWLIRRFIDPAAVFKFVDAKTYKARTKELRFDMADAEFTHEGTDCTFETLVRRTELGSDLALRAIAEMIHDLDVEEGKFGRPEAAGFAALIGGICASTSSDKARIASGSAALDQLYAYFSSKRA